MNRSKLESDITILDDELLKEQRSILLIESQIETKELTTCGSDDYFEWRARAVRAINIKRALCNSIKRQSNYWREKLKRLDSKERIEAQKELSEKHAKEKERRLDEHKKLIKLQQKQNIKKEKEKTARHRMSEERNIKIANSFKRLVKELLGEEKYIELIQKAEAIAVKAS